MIPQYGSTGIQTHETWILFGDPSLLVRTDAPEAISATYNPVMFIGMNEFEITAPDADGATVALSIYDEMEEEVVIMGTAIVEDGTATVHFENPPDVPGEMTLAITGFNKVTYINEEIQVIPPDGPYVIFDEYVIDDSEGNDNNQADYGEFISLDMSLKNVGIEVAQGVDATLTTESDYVTIVDNHFDYGDIDDDDSVMMPGAFSFEVDEVIPDNHNVMFTLTMTDTEGNEWESNFGLRIYSPMFEIGSFWVDDTEHGDGNGRLDPGEVADIIVEYTNTGGAPAMSPESEFFAANPYLTIQDYHFEHEIIESGETIEVTHTVEAHPSTIEGTFVDVFFSIEDAQYAESEQELVIGQVPEATIGDGTATPAQYPFYNYYKANRSQMLYHSDELGDGDMIIAEIGMDITHATGTGEHQVLPNFVIRMMHTDLNELGTSFVSTDDAIDVFADDDFQMPVPGEEGWLIFDIDNFEYDGNSNIIIEVVWGLLDTWCSFGDQYQVNGTEMNETRAVYGRSDTNPIPPYNGNSNILPNLYLAFEADEPDEAHELDFLIVGEVEQELEDASVRIGSLSHYTDELGNTSFTLLPGEYTFTVEKDGYNPHEDSIDLQDDTLLEIVMQLDAYPVTFLVDISRAVTHDLLEDFDPDNYHIFITGDMTDWTEPGEMPEYQVMEQTEEEHIYTITHNLAPGEYAYKYFSDAIGSGWDGGEWEGEPNRLIEVNDEIVIEEMFGPDDLSVIETGDFTLNLYPNPARTTLTAQADEQITNISMINIQGQVVYDASVSGAYSHDIDVSSLMTGIYMVQVTTTSGTATHRVQVTR